MNVATLSQSAFSVTSTTFLVPQELSFSPLSSGGSRNLCVLSVLSVCVCVCVCVLGVLGVCLVCVRLVCVCVENNHHQGETWLA